MLDQSFSSENFKTIFDSLNRKGIYLEQAGQFFNVDIFESSRKITQEIKIIDDEFKVIKKQHKQRIISFEDFIEKKGEYREKREILTKEREQSRISALQIISSKVNSENYKIQIEKGKKINNDQLYKISSNPEDFFVLKQIQYNINKTFGVKQSDRSAIISQLKLLLEDGFPKIIIRTDVQKFYESIPHNLLLAKIENSFLLSHLSKVAIKSILNQYWKFQIEDGNANVTDKRVGIPRGIGVSAYLSEIYMRNIDTKIKALPNVTFYSRYVDDIIVVFTPPNNIRHTTENLDTYKKQVEDLINKADLKINEAKTKNFSINNKELSGIGIEEFTYLGYKFIFGYCEETNTNGRKLKKRKLDIRLSQNRLDKYLEKIKLSFNHFRKSQLKYTSENNQYTKLLIQRIKYLTTNTNLNGHKKNVHIGIQFSNPFLTPNFEDLKELDRQLRSDVTSIQGIISEKILAQLQAFSFEDGYKNKKFHKFSSKTLENIIRIWK